MATTRFTRVRRTAVPAAILLALLGGCASPPIETDLEPSIRTPAEVSAEPSAGAIGGTGMTRGDTDGAIDGACEAGAETLLWGGVLLGASVLGETSQLEVLAHPLDRRQRPMTGRASEGRFLIVADGYLETVDYAPGRLITVLGTLEEVREGTIGEATVRYPVVRSDELHLWSGNAGSDERPRFSFGIGVNLGN